MYGNETIEIWTDGGCQPNPGVGGWAAIIKAPGVAPQVVSGRDADTTNNRMELTAAIESLRAILNPSTITIHTDSQYLKNGITIWSKAWTRNGWRTAQGKPVLNADLWRALLSEVRRHKIRWQWVKGHAGDPMNEKVDRIVQAARSGDAPFHIPGL